MSVAVRPVVIAEVMFWLCAALTFYVYVGYPALLWLLGRRLSRQAAGTTGTADAPTVSMIIPAHNEQDTIGAKIRNCQALVYPADRLEVVFVSDGSTDGTPDLIRAALSDRITLLELPSRSGKAAALNAGLARARGDIVLFTDASIQLEDVAVQNLVRPFADPGIGCVSGEDWIEGGGGEGLYGRYELFMRRQESAIGSIVGASGSLYAQRRVLCDSFPPNLAPDFFSVLKTVDAGYRAISEPTARGRMTALANASDEFNRKVRTLLRGMTTMAAYKHLLNPWRHGVFAFALLSHKIGRWLVPVFIVGALLASAYLARTSMFYAVLVALQVAVYLAALVGWAAPAGWFGSTMPVRVAVYFVSSNAAVLVAYLKYVAGTRQEIWAPSNRGGRS